jgi:hypothetical protein
VTFNLGLKQGMVVHIYNLSTWEAGAGGSSVQGQLGLHSKSLSQTNKTTTKEHK